MVGEAAAEVKCFAVVGACGGGVTEVAGHVAEPDEAVGEVAHGLRGAVLVGEAAGDVECFAVVGACGGGEQCLKPVDVDVREGRTFPVIE